MKGKPNEQQLRERIAYIHGRIEREIEAFATALSLPPMALTSRLGALLLGIPEGHDHSLPDVPVEAGPGSRVLAEVEGARQSHGGVARTRRQLAAGKRTGKAAPDKVSEGQKKYWADMTPEERSKEMARRRRKWSKASLAKWQRGGKPKQKKKSITAIYMARARAKKKGLPPPPLPKETQAA